MQPASTLAADWQAVRWPGLGVESPVDVATIADLDDRDNQLLIDDLVENAVVALAKAIFFLATELLTPWWARISREALNSPDDAFAILGGDSLQLLGR